MNGKNSINLAFDDLPIPPSVNSCYVSAGWGKRFPSKELKQFKKDCLIWGLSHIGDIERAREMLLDKTFLKADYVFKLAKSRLISKKGTIKKFDVSNRIKCIEDAISEMLDIDDCHFWTISATKKVLECEDEKESVSISISSL